MADFKKNISGSIRSARQWLARAEDSFGNDRDIRGELDLFLAQAELQRVQEAKRAGRWYHKFSLFSQGLALGLALFIAVAGIGSAYWWMHTQKNVPVPIDVQSQTLAGGNKSPVSPALDTPKPAAVQQQANPSTAVGQKEPSFAQPKAAAEVTVPAPNTAAEQPQKVQTLAGQAVSEHERPAEKEVVLPPDEMQKLIRAAGKSLRGQ